MRFPFSRELVYYITLVPFCQAIFSNFFGFVEFAVENCCFQYSLQPFAQKRLLSYKLCFINKYDLRTARHKITRLGKPGTGSDPASRRLARHEGFEPPTPWFVAKYSIQLS